MATERKAVTFNVGDPLEKACYDYADSINFNKWVKDRLKQVVLSLQAQRAKQAQEQAKAGTANGS